MASVDISPARSPDLTRQFRIERLESAITELAAHLTAAKYRFLMLIREFDAAEGWSGTGMRSCAHWLNWRCGINLGAAREQVRVAHALKDLPQISNAFESGAVSYAKVRAMTRVATPDNEEVLLNVARHGTAAHVERQVRLYRRVKRIEALEQDNARHAGRELYWHFDDDGCIVFRGRLSPEQGQLVVKALEGCMDELFEECKDVSAETSEEASAIDTRRADALVRMAEKALAGRRGRLHGGDRAMLHVHTDMETLKLNGTGAEAELEGAGSVSAETSRRLACDAGIVHWKDKEGEPLSIGRKSRTVPPAMRRALQRRDGGCRFPGCSCRRFVDAHHMVHWADGGETSMDNLVLLCRHHHRLVHEGGFTVQRQPDGEIRFTTPQGKIIPANGHRRFRGNALQLLTEHAGAGIRITPDTPVPGWHGERMDDDLAVLGLLQREEGF